MIKLKDLLFENNGAASIYKVLHGGMLGSADFRKIGDSFIGLNKKASLQKLQKKLKLDSDGVRRVSAVFDAAGTRAFKDAKSKFGSELDIKQDPKRGNLHSHMMSVDTPDEQVKFFMDKVRQYVSKMMGQ